MQCLPRNNLLRYFTKLPYESRELAEDKELASFILHILSRPLTFCDLQQQIALRYLAENTLGPVKTEKVLTAWCLHCRADLSNSYPTLGCPSCMYGISFPVYMQDIERAARLAFAVLST